VVDTPLASILINNYNYAQFLSVAIDSALAQTYPNIEVIVVDDGSTDNSREIIAGYGERVVAILKENGGQASAFNAGFAASKGDIICFLDADDAFLPEKASEVVRLFNQYPESNWVFHSLRQVDKVANKTIDYTIRVADGEQDMRARMLQGRPPFPAPATSALCFRRSLLAKILPMPEAKSITMSDLYLKELAIGLSKGYASHQVLAIQNIHQSNAYTGKKDNLRYKAIIAIQYAYWVRIKFPVFTERANRMFAIGLQYFWRIGGPELEYRSFIAKYWKNTCLWTRFKIWCLIPYYRIRLRSA